MILPNDDKVPEFSQDEYCKMVWKYFKDYNIRLPLKMLIYYTPWEEINKTTRYKVEYARKLTDGTWIDTGLMLSGKCYFVGDDKVGYVLPADILRMCLQNDNFGGIEENNIKFMIYPKKEVLDYAILITYFKRVIMPYSARIAPGASGV